MRHDNDSEAILAAIQRAESFAVETQQPHAVVHHHHRLDAVALADTRPWENIVEVIRP